ncbi:bifunctional Delta(1)-pyrroline-2-carboxylate/Delta(1)-piperideine-2-carboxylate reductase [Ramlibacter albus]|uniref:Delta(1)-pyrroline-2-carboxylate reductase family protein n=1 Tax=Ramlibacter albus TaxID=2079448 RepID=A0A923MD54_9BURK|nr:bifunctional Delta(1)-pyrroline-2-carboxylate/Delta(1)-piperideine-2-carboxylate reductase [Ramlibacter albus]MBC5767248.1 delta(1)-pyrroline-2-carboxylate reductase family protein [Ramlibacter albus]
MAHTPTFHDAQATAARIGFAAVVDALALASREYLAGTIHCPARIGVPLAGSGISLSMPASAADISIHKLVNVQPANAAQGLPTILGVVTVCDARTGQPLCFLDGPVLTGRRTAGVSLLGMRTFAPANVAKVLLVGTGTQAAFHLAGLAELYPQCRVLVKGTSPEAERKFCDANRSVHASIEPCPSRIPDDVQVVIALTSSRKPVYDEPASKDRLVIGVGAFTPEMAEIGPRTLEGSDIYVDDPVGARHEAGDLLQAKVDWARVKPLASALETRDRARPVVLKTVGSAAWDLAAARVALSSNAR